MPCVAQRESHVCYPMHNSDGGSSKPPSLLGTTKERARTRATSVRSTSLPCLLPSAFLSQPCLSERLSSPSRLSQSPLSDGRVCGRRGLHQGCWLNAQFQSMPEESVRAITAASAQPPTQWPSRGYTQSWHPPFSPDQEERSPDWSVNRNAIYQ